MKSRTALVTGLVTGAIIAGAVPAAAAPAAPSLPAPSGPYQVGQTDLHLVDGARTDPWQPGQRELMVSVHYPATQTAGLPKAPYMSPGAAAHFDSSTVNQMLNLDVPPGTDWASVGTNAARGAPAATGEHPVVVSSPGLGEPRTWGTGAAEDLASRGYVVVSIDHTYEAPEVQFPDGSVRTMIQPEDPNAFIRKALDVRVRDTSFVLDQLGALDAGQNPDAERRRLPDGLTGTLGLEKVGMIGHSMGGSAAAATALHDPRIAAGINLDGNLTYLDNSPMPAADEGIKQPFLLVGKDGETDTGPGWQAFRQNTQGWQQQLKLRTAAHASFTDAESLLPRLGLPEPVLTKDLGTLDPRTAIRTQRAYIGSFIDRFVRDRDDHLLDGPSPRHPDMLFE